MAGVVLENVSRLYPGNVLAVDGVDLSVLDREFLVLVGPSGCGKTTALRLIAGLEELSGGKIVIGARTVNDVPAKDRDIAMVFQNYALYPHMNVYRNMAFGLELREGVSRWGWLWQWALPAARKAALATRRFSIAQRVHEAAKVLGIEDLLERLPGQLSGGQRQRVALGRAIVRNPAVFLFDEPLSNLDAKLRVEMRRELKQLHRRLRATMIYVTHDQVEALTLGERIVVMNEGKVQQVGKPMEVYDWPANRFVAGFIGTPAMNFIAGELVNDGNEPRFCRGGLCVSLTDRPLVPGLDGTRPAVLGVRPEDIRAERLTQPRMSVSERSAENIATVRLLESVGDATLATLELADAARDEREPHDAARAEHNHDGDYVLSKMEPRSDLRGDERVGLRIDPLRVHIFDPETGRNWVRRP